MYKVYLVTFKIEGKKVYKIGITGKSDVQARFQHLIDNGTITDFKIHLSRWVEGEDTAKERETECFTEIVLNFPENNYITGNGNAHFHNFWLKKKVGGVTEIRKYDHKEYLFAYSLVDKSGYRYLSECS